MTGGQSQADRVLIETFGANIEPEASRSPSTPDSLNHLPAIIRDAFQLDGDHPITSSTRFSSDLDADSFQMIALACALEEHFHIDLHDVFLDDIATVADLFTLIENKIGNSTRG